MANIANDIKKNESKVVSSPPKSEDNKTKSMKKSTKSAGGADNLTNNNNNTNTNNKIASTTTKTTKQNKTSPKNSKKEKLDNSTSSKTDVEDTDSLDQSNNANTPLPLRKGKWMVEEEDFTSRIIFYYNNGLLTLPESQTLRSYISKKLNCDPMRITKKFTGACCIGKRFINTVNRNQITQDDIKSAGEDLKQLEARYREALEKENDGYRTSDIMKRTAIIAETSWLMNQQLLNSGMYMGMPMGGMGGLPVGLNPMYGGYGLMFPGQFPNGGKGPQGPVVPGGGVGGPGGLGGANLGKPTANRPGPQGPYQIPGFDPSQLQQLQQQQAQAVSMMQQQQQGVPTGAGQTNSSNTTSSSNNSENADDKSKTVTKPPTTVSPKKLNNAPLMMPAPTTLPLGGKIVDGKVVDAKGNLIPQPGMPNANMFNFANNGSMNPQQQMAMYPYNYMLGMQQFMGMQQQMMMQQQAQGDLAKDSKADAKKEVGGSKPNKKSVSAKTEPADGTEIPFLIGNKRELSLSLGSFGQDDLGLIANFSMDSSMDVLFGTPTTSNNGGGNVAPANQVFFFENGGETLINSGASSSEPPFKRPKIEDSK